MGDVRWLITCTEGTVPEEQTYATEQAAHDVIGLHAGGCCGGHTVEPVTWVEDGEGRARLAAARRPSEPVDPHQPETSGA